MEEDEKYINARKRVRSIRDFYGHVLIYLVVNIFLLVINLVMTPDRLWFFWVTLGWGIAVVLNAIAVFGIAGKWGSDWEEKKIKKILEKDNPHSQNTPTA
jgi:hypothetical protein